MHIFQSLKQLIKPEQKMRISSISGTIKIGKSYGRKTLFVQGVAQSGGEYEFMWNKSVQQISAIRNALVLGVGGGTVIQVLQKRFPDLSITGIELDPTILQLAREEFNIKENTKLKLLREDAIQWIQRNTKKYDCIVVDLYIAAKNPPLSRTKNFLQQIKNSLSSNGVVLINCHYDKANPKEYEDYFTLCEEVFSSVQSVFSYPKNHILKLQ